MALMDFQDESQSTFGLPDVGGAIRIAAAKLGITTPEQWWAEVRRAERELAAAGGAAGAPGNWRDSSGVFGNPKNRDRQMATSGAIVGGLALGGTLAGLGGFGGAAGATEGAAEGAGAAGAVEGGVGTTAAAAPTATLPAAGTTLEGLSAAGGTTAAPIAAEYGLGTGATGYGTSGTAAVPATTGGTSGGIAAAGTPLSRLLDGTATTADYASLLGTAGSTALGMYSSGRQGDALRDIAAQSRADRAPFLEASKRYLADPASYFEGPGRGAMDATLAGLSAKFGNPIGSGAALQFATGAGLQDWRNAVTGFGNLGLSGEDTRSQLLAGGAQKDADVFTNLGGGISDIINPRRSLADLLREYKSVGLI